MMVLSCGMVMTYQFFIMQAIERQNMMECEFNRILENLDEAIICKSDQGITFVNNVGQRILQNIHSILQGVEEIHQDQSQAGLRSKTTPANGNISMEQQHMIRTLLPESLLEKRSLFSNNLKKSDQHRELE